LCLECYNGR